MLEVTAVIEHVEVLDHVLDDLRIVARFGAIGFIFCRLELDDSRLSFLLTFSDNSVRMPMEYRTLNFPLFSAVLKNLD
jgi:hypothetical protein